MNLPETRLLKTIVALHEADQRLDRFLTSRFTYLTRNQWQKNILSGRVLLNGRHTRPARILNANDEIVFLQDETQKEPSVSCDFRIIYEDDHLLVVNKPANLPTHPAGLYFNNTLWSFLRPRYGNLHIITRLDRETSGLVLIARDPQTASMLSQIPIIKTYYAIVEGRFEIPIHAKGYLFADQNSLVRKKRAFSVEKPDDSIVSETSDTFLEPVSIKDKISCVRATLGTGRLHQIRATLRSLGYPMVGDKIYGVNDLFYIKFIEQQISELDYKMLRLERQALHAYFLEFAHPITGKTLQFELPLPADMQSLL